MPAEREPTARLTGTCVANDWQRDIIQVLQQNDGRMKVGRFAKQMKKMYPNLPREVLVQRMGKELEELKRKRVLQDGDYIELL